MLVIYIPVGVDKTSRGRRNEVADKTDRIRFAAVAAVLEYVRRERGDEAPAGKSDSKSRIGWKMAGRCERLGIKDSEIPFKGRTWFEIHRKD